MYIYIYVCIHFIILHCDTFWVVCHRTPSPILEDSKVQALNVEVSGEPTPPQRGCQSPL